MHNATHIQILQLVLVFGSTFAGYLIGREEGRHNPINPHTLDDCILDAVAHFNSAGPDATPIGDAIARKMGVTL